MPVRFQTPPLPKTEGVIVKELVVSEDGGRNGGSRNKVAIKIRILPHKKVHAKLSSTTNAVEQPASKIIPPCHNLHAHHHRQPRMAKRTRFSCWSDADSSGQHPQHYDVTCRDATYLSTAATASRPAYSSSEWFHEDCQLQCCDENSDDQDDFDHDGRRRRSYRTGHKVLSTFQAAAFEDVSDEVFEDSRENRAWEDSERHPEVLRSMNRGLATDQRRQRVSQPLPTVQNIRRSGGPRGAVAVAAAPVQGDNERRVGPMRRALTDLEAAEFAAGGYTHYIGDTATVNAADSARRRVASKKSQDSGSKTQEDETQKAFDDEEGYYIHTPHDQIAYRYEVSKVLGRGSFGQVVRAFDQKTRRWVALKIVRSEERFRRQAVDEVRMLNLLSRTDVDGRSHVVRMLDHFEFRRHPCIVFEPLGVDLYEALRRRGYRGFPLASARRAAYGIVRCLALLRRHRIIHCDLKPENVLLTVPPSQQRRTSAASNHINVKVIDFGSSCFETDQLYVYVQSRFYRAPEVILGAGYGTPVDMWSLGCIVAELVTGRPLFAGDDEFDQLTSQLEYLGMPPARLLAKSRRAAQFFSSTTNLPRYCSIQSKSRDDIVDDFDEESSCALPPLVGSVNKSGTYRHPPGSKQLDAALLKITGRESSAFDRRHRDYIDFVRRCVEWEPSARMTPEEALRHVWMQQDPSTRSHRVQPPHHRPTEAVLRGRPASHGDENEYS